MKLHCKDVSNRYLHHIYLSISACLRRESRVWMQMFNNLQLNHFFKDHCTSCNSLWLRGWKNIKAIILRQQVLKAITCQHFSATGWCVNLIHVNKTGLFLSPLNIATSTCNMIVTLLKCEAGEKQQWSTFLLFQKASFLEEF